MKQPFQNNHNKKHSQIKDRAYFTSKTELLAWINNTLHLEITGIEQAKTGAIFCQLLDAAYPGKVKMNKVNWSAKSEPEYISNFKIFQQGLIENNIDKPINIDRLVKGKNKELIELLQWIYGHHLFLGIDSSNYDAIRNRNGQILSFYDVERRNTLNNKNTRDLSPCSSNIASRDNKKKNSMKNMNNINNLNTNFGRNDFNTKFNYPKQQHHDCGLNVIENKKNQGKYNFNFLHNNNSLDNKKSISLGGCKNRGNNFKNKNEKSIMSTLFYPKEKIDEKSKKKEVERINVNKFDGVNNADKSMELIINNYEGIIKRITRERNFYINKLKDIEYLFFNPDIKNTNENKICLLRQILESNSDTNISINEKGLAWINGNENFIISSDENNKNKEGNRIQDIIDGNNNNLNKSTENCDKIGKKSQNELSVKMIFPKDDFLKIPIHDKFSSDGNGNYFNINRPKTQKEKKIQIIPENKVFDYDITKYLINEPLNIYGLQNDNHNIKNNY